MCALGATLVPFWGICDVLVEPALSREFLWLRATDFVVGAIAFAIIVRARRLSTLRAAGWLRVFYCGSIITVMCAQVSEAHFYPYVLGLSLVFWSNGILHTWTLRYSVVFGPGLFLVYLVAHAFTGPPRALGDEVAALFYLGSTALISAGTAENRRRLHYHTLLATRDLDLRNRELDATVRSLRETQTRLVESEKLSALGRLIASLSHEINNPVNVLQNNLDPFREYLQQIVEVAEVALAKGDVEAAWAHNDLDFVLSDAADALETMAEGMRRIQTVHGEMRAFVRGDAPEMQVGDVGEGLRATVNMFRRAMPSGMSIHLRSNDLPPIRFQPGQMNQVFFNLIQNAVDAIEAAGRSGVITVSTEVDAARMTLVVEDTGPGVSAWAREHLFEPFFTTKGAGKGTGLGLATSYQIVQRHQGSIELDDGYLAGARFVVRLPIAATGAPAARVFGRVKPPEPGAGERGLP
jgi:signal transduction histidine kinase